MQLARGHRVQFAGTSFLNYNECGEVVDRVSGQRRDQFTYDAQGLIEQAQMANGETIRFTYDPHSRLTSCQAGDRRVDYFWNGEQLSVIQDSTRGLIRFLSLPESYSPFEQIVAGRRFTLHRDRNGKVHTMIDEAGVIVWRVGLDPWVPSMDPQFPLGFPGQIADPVTGLFYNRYRFYNPESAQYLSSDPVGLWAAVDGYRYPQDPVNLIDPDGLKCRGKNDDPLVWKNAKRPPSVICKDGFKAINPNGTTSIADHVEGAVHDSPWISTTHRKDFAEKWMKSDGNQRYVYEIENPGCGVEVDCDPKLIAKYGTDPADSEHEIAFHKEIPVGKVKGYYPVGPGGVLGPFQSC
jgi:RHS repeat-associated protein